MKPIVTFLRRYASPMLLFAACIASWLGFSLLLEDYQASIGPDFLGRIPVKLVHLAVAIILLRHVIRFVFPTIARFTDTDGGHRESDFARQWRDQPTDPRLWISIIVYLGAFFVLSQLLLA